MDKALSFLGLCRRAGKLLIGEDGVSGAARSGQAVLLMVASDTADNTRKKAGNLSRWYGIPMITLPWDKDTLGELLDKRVCAILALTDKCFPPGPGGRRRLRRKGPGKGGQSNDQIPRA